MPELHLAGTLTATPERVGQVLDLLDDHIRLTRAEPGCLWFQIVQSRCNPCEFLVSERFVDRAAFEAHQARTAGTAWALGTSGLLRAFQITEKF